MKNIRILIVLFILLMASYAHALGENYIKGYLYITEGTIVDIQYVPDSGFFGPPDRMILTFSDGRVIIAHHFSDMILNKPIKLYRNNWDGKLKCIPK